MAEKLNVIKQALVVQEKQFGKISQEFEEKLEAK